MIHFNRIIMRGRVTKAPEPMKIVTNTDRPGVRMRMSTHCQTGTRRESCFIDVIYFGRAGEYLMQNAVIGDAIMVEGRLQTNVYRQGKFQKYFYVVQGIGMPQLLGDKLTPDDSKSDEAEAVSTDELDEPEQTSVQPDAPVAPTEFVDQPPPDASIPSDV